MGKTGVPTAHGTRPGGIREGGVFGGEGTGDLGQLLPWLLRSEGAMLSHRRGDQGQAGLRLAPCLPLRPGPADSGVGPGLATLPLPSPTSKHSTCPLAPLWVKMQLLNAGRGRWQNYGGRAGDWHTGLQALCSSLESQQLPSSLLLQTGLALCHFFSGRSPSCLGHAHLSPRPPYSKVGELQASHFP